MSAGRTTEAEGGKVFCRNPVCWGVTTLILLCEARATRARCMAHMAGTRAERLLPGEGGKLSTSLPTCGAPCRQQYSTVMYCTIQPKVAENSALQHTALLQIKVLHCKTQDSAVQCSTVQ